MKRKELMAIVAVAAGLTSGVAATTHAYAAPKFGFEQGQDNDDRGDRFDRFDRFGRFAAMFDHDHRHPGHFIGRGHFEHGNGHGFGHHHHDHDIY